MYGSTARRNLEALNQSALVVMVEQKPLGAHGLSWRKARHYVEKNAESLALADRRRVQTLHSAGPSTGIRHIPEAELAQVRKGELFRAEDTVERFRNLNRQIQTFCDHWAEHIAKDKPLPQTPSTSSYVGSPAADFPSAEEYALFTLLSIVITVLYRKIFRPFHPATTPEKNLNIQKLYKQEMKTCQSSDLSQRLALKCHHLCSFAIQSRCLAFLGV